MQTTFRVTVETKTKELYKKEKKRKNLNDDDIITLGVIQAKIRSAESRIKALRKAKSNFKKAS